MRLTFEGCVFDSDTREVLRGGSVAPVSPKAFLLLELLIQERPKAVSKAEIRKRLWPETFVSEANLANLVVELRSALGDSARKPRILRTVRRYGYAFQAETRENVPRPPHSPASGLAYRLVWGRREIALDPGENLIGRDHDSVVWIDDESVSRRHARIVIREQGATLEDLGSKNGTHLRGRKVGSPARLVDKDSIKIGPATIVFRVFKRTGSTLSTVDARDRT